MKSPFQCCFCDSGKGREQYDDDKACGMQTNNPNKTDSAGNDKVYLKREHWSLELPSTETLGCLSMSGWLLSKEVVYEMMLCDGGTKFMDAPATAKCSLFLTFNKHVQIWCEGRYLNQLVPHTHSHAARNLHAFHTDSEPSTRFCIHELQYINVWSGETHLISLALSSVRKQTCKRFITESKCFRVTKQMVADK